MKKYLLVIDGYGTIETDDEGIAIQRYDYFSRMGIPVAMYTRTKFFKDNKPNINLSSR